MTDEPMVVLGKVRSCWIRGCPNGPEPHRYVLSCDVAARREDPPTPIDSPSEVDRLHQEIQRLIEQKWLAASATAGLWGRVQEHARRNGLPEPKPPADVAAVLAWLKET